MLLRTSVIGSGLGGMRELLEGGKQIICEDFDSLGGKVISLLENLDARRQMGKDGYTYAKKFSLETFEGQWLELVRNILNNR